MSGQPRLEVAATTVRAVARLIAPSLVVVHLSCGHQRGLDPTHAAFVRQHPGPLHCVVCQVPNPVVEVEGHA